MRLGKDFEVHSSSTPAKVCFWKFGIFQFTSLDINLVFHTDVKSRDSCYSG